VQISILSDEISTDFDTAVEVGLSWGIRNFEVRMVPTGRVPKVSPGDRKRFLDVKKRYGVTISSISPGFFKCSVDAPEVEKDMREALPAAFDMARELGTDRVIIFGFGKPGKTGAEMMHADGAKYPPKIIDLLGAMADKAKAGGCRLFLENEPICWGDTGTDTAAIIRKVHRDNLMMNWDLCNSFHCLKEANSSLKPYPDEYETFKDLVGHVHVKDMRWADGKGQVVPVGKGNIDWAGQLKALLRDGYNDYLVIETHFHPRYAGSKACWEALRQMLLDVL
jgi:sugar phosphate isomerase/epimerase